MKYLLLLSLAACAGGPTPAQQVGVGVDYDNQMACVAKYSTRAEIDACRDAVKAHRYTDAGGDQ